MLSLVFPLMSTPMQWLSLVAHYKCIILNILCMQSISLYISCIKLIKYNIVNKTGVKEFSLSNPSSFHGIPLPHNGWFGFMVLATSRHAISQICPYWQQHCLSKQPLVLFCSSFKLWWFSIVLCWIRFPMPIHMLHSDLRCENHTISKMMAKHTTEFWFGMRTSAT